jgi:hypothetical protein
MKRLRHRNVGRPPAGLNGERASEYPQLAVRVPRITVERLRAVATRERRAMWRVLVDAIETYDRLTRPGDPSIGDEIPASAAPDVPLR